MYIAIDCFLDLRKAVGSWFWHYDERVPVPLNQNRIGTFLVEISVIYTNLPWSLPYKVQPHMIL